MALYLTMAVCAVLMATIVYRYDLHDREPMGVLLLAVVLGAASIFLAGRAQVWIMTALGPVAAARWELAMALVAGFTEELGKLTCVLVIACTMRRWFNDPLDGLVYGSMAGLGAAIEESVSLLASQAPAPDSLPPTEAVRLAGHLIMGGVTGFGAGALVRSHAGPSARHPERASNRAMSVLWVPLSLFLGVGLHAAWDYVAFTAPSPSSPSHAFGWHTALSMALMLLGFVLYRWLVRRGAGLAESWLKVGRI